MSSATDSLYATIRRRIMAGHYAPGTQLKEERLAEEMAVSRTPVRAALHRLVGDRMLIAAAHRGVFVAEWTRMDIAEVFELRSLLEPYAAKLAAERATSEQLDGLRRFTDRMEALSRPAFRDNLPEIQAANHGFHSLVIEAAASPRLKGMASNLVDMPMILGSFYFYSDADMQRSIQHHRELIMAIEAKDPTFAQQVMTVHLRVTHEVFMRNRQA